MPNTKQHPGESRLQQQHRSRLEQLRNELTAIAGAAAKAAQAINQVLDTGGSAQIQPQISFLTGAFARTTKDWGVVEHLQAEGARQRKPPQAR